MGPNELGTEQLGIVATIDPATITTAVYSDVIDMSKYLQVVGIFLLGNMAADNVVCAAYRCDSSGANAAAIKTKTLAGNASANDNTQVKIGVRKEDLLPQAVYNRYIKFGMSNAGGSGGPAGMVAIAVDANYGPAKNFDLATVTILDALDP